VIFYQKKGKISYFVPTNDHFLHLVHQTLKSMEGIAKGKKNMKNFFENMIF